MKEMTIEYIFHQQDGSTKSFEINLDKDLNLQLNESLSYPTWCELYFYKCPTCTLDAAEQEFCPAAMAVYEIFDFFEAIHSYDMVDVEVIMPQRSYRKNVSIQKAISSIVGLVMASSSCPILSRLKPFVKLHLPFASLEETVTRILSFYLLAQYYKKRIEDREPDWNLEGLKKIYDEVGVVNKSFFQRIQKAFHGDGDINSLTILDSLADSVNFSLDGLMKNDFQQILLKYF